MRAGFAEADITPPVGTHKIGWINDLVGVAVADPLSARIAVFEGDGGPVAFVGLDTLSVRWTTTTEIRRRVARQYGFPGDRVMVGASHNHAGPAVAEVCEVARNDGYVAAMVDAVVDAFGAALERLCPARLGFEWAYNHDIARNRRVVMRDGTVRTHGRFTDPQSLCLEGPVDPELAVLAARDADGTLLGAVVNYTCHPTHHGGDQVFSAGWPGALAAAMKAKGCPITVFLNGAAGNVHFADPCGTGPGRHHQEIGQRLADDAARVIDQMAFREEIRTAGVSGRVDLPYRPLTDAEINGTVPGAQRFRPEIYARLIPDAVARARQRGTQPAEVQVLAIDDLAVVSLPAEAFVELGLRIKEAAHPRHALIAGYANGMVGYVPHREAFARGGYETTFMTHSRLGYEAGDLLVELAIELLESLD